MDVGNVTHSLVNQEKPIEVFNKVASTEQRIDFPLIMKVSQAVMSTISQMRIDNDELVSLGRLDYKLETEIKWIKGNTTGFLAFFRYLFRPKQRTDLEQLAQRMHDLRNFINNVKKAKPERSKVEESKPASEKDKPLVKDDPKAVEDGAAAPADPSIANLLLGDVPPSGPAHTDAPQAGDAPIAPPPPPPPGIAPPPPMPKAKTKEAELSPEQKYMAEQKKRLEDKRKNRAKPNMFNVSVTNKDEAKLQKDKAKFERVLASYQRCALGEDDADVIFVKDELKKIEDQLVPEQRPISFKHSDFKGKIANYNNDELALLVGMLFDGKVPDESHPNHSNYIGNKELMDSIFQDWDRLSKGDTGKLFLTHADEWKKYLSVNLFGVVETLKNRRLPIGNKEHLAEPKHEIVPYAERKAAKAALQLPKEAAKGGTFDVSAIKEARLRKGADRPLQAARQEPMNARDAMLSGIKGKRELKKVVTVDKSAPVLSGTAVKKFHAAAKVGKTTADEPKKARGDAMRKFLNSIKKK